MNTVAIVISKTKTLRFILSGIIKLVYITWFLPTPVKELPGTDVTIPIPVMPPCVPVPVPPVPVPVMDPVFPVTIIVPLGPTNSAKHF